MGLFVLSGIFIAGGVLTWLVVRASFGDCPRIRGVWNTYLASSEAIESARAALLPQLEGERIFKARTSRF